VVTDGFVLDIDSDHDKLENVIGLCKKKSIRTVKHIWFLPTSKVQTKNQKGLNFVNAQ